METHLTYGSESTMGTPIRPGIQWGTEVETLIRVVYNKTQKLDMVCIHKDLYQSTFYMLYLNIPIL